MNNLYHKVAVAFIGLALSLALGTDKEAKAVTITLIPLQFSTIDQDRNGLGDWSSGPFAYGVKSLPAGTFDYGEVKATYEFNIGNLSLAPNTVKSARFNAIISDSRRSPGGSFFVNLSGYAGNGRPDASDFEAGESLRSEDLSFGGDYRTPSVGISWDIAPFINQLLSNNESAFAGLSISTSGERFSVGGVFTDSSYPDSPYASWYPTLEIEPVPEPTTIFGSAIFLGVGGWLKRKKSNQQNQTAPQR